jgi:hypothetical protein
MSEEEINIDEKIITLNEETMLRTTLIEMRTTTTTTRTIVRILTVQISITIINEITATEIEMINEITIIIATIIKTVNTGITYVHAMGIIIASKVTTNREAAAEA